MLTDLRFSNYLSAEVKLYDLWTVGVGENSKEVDVQKNRNRRERETFYYTIQEIPSNPKEPWDREMDYDDTLTPEIPTEQPPDTDCAETQAITHDDEHVKNAATLAPSSSQASGGDAAEPDLELLAVLLKNPALVFALTSGQGGNLTNEETVKLLDMIKAGGAGDSSNVGKKVEEKVEVSLPSPTPSIDSGTVRHIGFCQEFIFSFLGDACSPLIHITCNFFFFFFKKNLK